MTRSFVLNKLSAALSYILRLLFPPKCISCKELLLGSSELCEDCLSVWKEARNARCPVCQKTARACTCRPFSLSHTDSLGERTVTALAFYAKFGSEELRDILVRRIVYAVKTDPDRSAVRFAARELSREILRSLALSGEKAEDWSITYPPRSRKRIIRYGFDQGRDLAKEISRYTGIAFVDLLLNTKGTTQKSLNAIERQNNAKRAYSLKKNAAVKGKYFVVDDVITTGATVNTIAQLLQNAGADAVYPVCIARSKRKKRKKLRPSARPWFKNG